MLLGKSSESLIGLTQVDRVSDLVAAFQYSASILKFQSFTFNVKFFDLYYAVVFYEG